MEKLQENYKNKLIKDLQKEFGYKNVYQAPDLEKVTLNMAFGAYKDNKDYLAEAEDDLKKIAGQAPSKRYAKKAISNFKLREGELIGLAVTLRDQKAWDFLEKLIYSVLPSVRDFRGLSRKSFDGKGNYCFGIKEHFVFPEINPDKVKYLKSLQVNIVTSTDNDKESERMLESIGFPLVKSKTSKK